LGDSTSHGGKVLEGSQTEICHGKPIAFIGHKVSCPKCSGTHTIVEGVQTTTIFGKGVAVAGMKTSCGATLIAGQFTDVIVPGGGGGSSAAPAPVAKAAPVAASPAGPIAAKADGKNEPTADAPVAEAGEDAGIAEAAEKAVKRIWWSYGKDETPLTDASRHYVDLNLHVETENYASGEAVSFTLANDDGDLLVGQPEFNVEVPVGADGVGKLLNVFAGKSIVLGQLG